MGDGDRISVVLERPEGAGPLRIVCAHDSQHLPQDFAFFGFADVRPNSSHTDIDCMPWRGVDLASLTVDRGNLA
jgi:hypothetical protein